MHCELGLERRLHHCEDDRHVLGLATRHHCADCDLLDGARCIVRRDSADHLLRIARRSLEHAQYPYRGRRDHRQPVAPASGEAQFVLVLGGRYIDDPRRQRRRSERDLQNLRHARVHALRAASRPEFGEIAPEWVEPGDADPLGAVPAHRAHGLGAPVETNQRRYRLDIEAPRMLQRTVVDRVQARRKRRIVLGVDGQRRTACRNFVQDRLHEIAGGAVAFGDDDEARAHSNLACRSRSGRTSSRPFGGMVIKARKTPASR